MQTNKIDTTGFRFSAFCIVAALVTYMSMYAFRKPLSAATFEGLTYWGMDYKIIAIISQVIGYTCSKFLGVTPAPNSWASGLSLRCNRASG